MTASKPYMTFFTNEVSEFFASIDEAETIDEIWKLARKTLQQLGFEKIGFAINLDGPQQLILWTASDSVVDLYVETILKMGIDPITHHCRRNIAPILTGIEFIDRFSDVEIDYKHFIEEIAREKVRIAMNVPVHSAASDAWGYFSLTSDLTAEQFKKCGPPCVPTALSCMMIAYSRIMLLNKQERIKLPQLSPRERECLLWLAKGERNEQIAHRLNLTRSTVEFHINNARVKLNACTREQALVSAALKGLIDP